MYLADTKLANSASSEIRTTYSDDCHYGVQEHGPISRAHVRVNDFTTWREMVIECLRSLVIIGV